MPGRALGADGADQGDGHPFDAGEVRHEIIKRLEVSRLRVLQDLLEPSLRFAGKKRDAHRLGAMNIGIVAAQHAHRSRNMESAYGHLNAALQQRLGQIEGVRKLVRLHADKHDHAVARLLNHAREPLRTHARIRFVKRMDLDLDVLAQDAALLAIAGQTVKGGQRIRRDRRTKPLDHVPVIVVVRRFDEDEAKALRGALEGVVSVGIEVSEPRHHTQIFAFSVAEISASIRPGEATVTLNVTRCSHGGATERPLSR